LLLLAGLAPAPLTLGQEGVKELAKTASQKASALGSKAGGMLTSNPWTWGHAALAVLIILGLLFADVIRPGSFRRKGVRKVEGHPAFIWWACAALVFGVQILAGGFLRFIPEKHLGPTESFQYSAVSSAVVLGASVFAAWLIARLAKREEDEAGFRFSGRGVVWGVTGFLLAWPVVTAAGVLFTHIASKAAGAPPESVAHPVLQNILAHRGSTHATLAIVTAVLLAPIAEEFIYRGFLQTGFLRITGWPWISALLTAGLFALVHRIGDQPLPWHAAGTVGVLGLCMGIAYERTKEIGVPIVMHMLFNSANIVLAMAAKQG
jgi:membrane protease YdiL (CAAX protease family)